MIDLPRWPSHGDRRRLEALWLEKLEAAGPHSAPQVALSEVPSELAKAIRQFNARLFWECHETLEDLWRATPYPLRFFYHAIIKLAVGFHHMSRHNRHGARVKLSDGVRLLALFQPQFQGVRTDLLLGDGARWLRKVDGAGRVDWQGLEAIPTPVIQMAR